MRLVSICKNLIVPKGRKPRRILGGAFGGLVMNLDLATQTQLYVGTFEREVQPWLQRFSSGADTAIDVGMAEGEYSLFFLRQPGLRSVLGFEPFGTSRAAINENLSLNGLSKDSRLRLSSAFVGDSPGPETETLDSLLPQIGKPVVIKVDVDGGEMAVLRGADKLIAGPATRWIIETHTPVLERECIERLKSAGYKVRIIPKAWWRILLPEMRTTAHRPENHNQWLVAARPEDLFI
jgi:hypothetical protein